MYSTAEMLEMAEEIKNVFLEDSECIIFNLVQTGRLEEFNSLIGNRLHLTWTLEGFSDPSGRILVIGQSDIEKKHLEGVAKSVCIDKDRFEFYLDYNDAKTFDFKKIRYSFKYSCILVGPMPHSGVSKGKNSSIIDTLKTEEGYPKVIHMGAEKLKITKSSFKNTLLYAVGKGIIAQNH